MPISGPILAPTDPRVALVAIAVAAYLLPSVIALAGHHPRRRRLLAGNVLLGWTVVGWAICLSCALRAAHRRRTPRRGEVVAR